MPFRIWQGADRRSTENKGATQCEQISLRYPFASLVFPRLHTVVRRDEGRPKARIKKETRFRVSTSYHTQNKGATQCKQISLRYPFAPLVFPRLRTVVHRSGCRVRHRNPIGVVTTPRGARARKRREIKRNPLVGFYLLAHSKQRGYAA